MAFGEKPQETTCPSCHATVVTKISSHATKKTHLIALILCLCSCWLCVCCPYCINACKSIHHNCPKCNAFIGSYEALGNVEMEVFPQKNDSD